MIRLLLERYCAPKTEIPRRVSLSVSVIVVVLIMGGWCAATYGGLVRTTFLPPPHAVFVAGAKSIADGSLLKHSWASIRVSVL